MNIYGECVISLITAAGFYRIEERDVLKQLVDQALAWRTCLSEIVDFALAYFDKDLTVISKKLTTAIKVLVDTLPLMFDVLGCRSIWL